MLLLLQCQLSEFCNQNIPRFLGDNRDGILLTSAEFYRPAPNSTDRYRFLQTALPTGTEFYRQNNRILPTGTEFYLQGPNSTDITEIGNKPTFSQSACSRVDGCEDVPGGTR